MQYSESEELSIHSFDDGDISPYAILSHTLGTDVNEVTYADLETGHGKTKPGYNKIRFCGDQVRRDGLQYFWIDTCCINRVNKAVLTFAIRSIFRWYRNVARCCVGLSGISNQPLVADQGRPDYRWPIWIWMFSALYFLLSRYISMTQHFFHSRHIHIPSIKDVVVYSRQKPEFMLQKSRWFTCGWTLQEFLEPCTVEPFS